MNIFGLNLDRILKLFMTFQNKIQSESKFIRFNMNIGYNNTFSNTSKYLLQHTHKFRECFILNMT